MQKSRPSSVLLQFGTVLFYKTFTEVYANENWVVCVGPMFRIWWQGDDCGKYSCPIDYYVGRMKEVDPSIETEPDNPGTDPGPT